MNQYKRIKEFNAKFGGSVYRGQMVPNLIENDEIEKFLELEEKLNTPWTIGSKNFNPATGGGELGVTCFYTIKEIVNIVKPNWILEIGFNRGGSALMWLLTSNAFLVSCDIRKPEKTIQSINFINETFANRFEYISLDTVNNLKNQQQWINKFDLIFIDGDHSYAGAKGDTIGAKALNIEFISYDDYNSPKHGVDIHRVIKEENLTIIKEFNTKNGQVLTRNDSYSNSTS